MRGWCLEIEVVWNSLNLYCGRVQDRLNNVVRLSFKWLESVTACLALELGWDARTLHGRLNELGT
jgi:hypothetical protein